MIVYIRFFNIVYDLVYVWDYGNWYISSKYEIMEN